MIFVTYNELQAKKIKKDLEYFAEEVLLFPKREIFAYDYIAESKENYYQRMNVLNKLHDGTAKIIVTTMEAVMQPMPQKKILYQNQMTIHTGDTLSMETLKQKLMMLGYERYDLADAGGQFSLRGGIMDVAISNQEGVRIEFWGDTVDSIRFFDLNSQRSTTTANEISLKPVMEFVLEKPVEKIAEKIRKEASGQEEIIEEDIATILQGNFTEKVDRYFHFFYEEPVTFFDYIPSHYLIFLDEASKLKARSENILKDSQQIMKSLLEKRKPIPDSFRLLKDYVSFIETLGKRQIIFLEKQDLGLIDKQTMHAKRNGYSFSYREVNFFRSSMDLLFEEVQKARADGKTVILLGGSKENCKKLSKTLTEKGIPNEWMEDALENIPKHKVLIHTGVLSAGFESYDFELLMISGEELFAPPKKRKILSSEFKQGETVVFTDLKPGDYVVHRNNGIGQFMGVSTIKADGIIKDYIQIRYRDDDMLYIPINQMDNIRKYIGAGEAGPRLNRLGGKEWSATKQKVKSNLREVAKDLIELYAKRQKMTGFAFSQDTEWQKQFEEDFRYTETEDQLRCIEEVKKDMEQPKPMDRLLCGDVGYGKTEVAIRAAFKACMDQKQVAYLVPTTVLANQQYEAFKERMQEFPIRIELLNRFRTKKEQDIILKKLKLRRN